MALLDLIKQRKSVREFLDKPVEREKIEMCLEAARLAPSASNSQPWHFIVITDEKKREAVSSTYNGQWIRSAPVIVAACGDHSESWKRGDGKDHLDIDLAIAIVAPILILPPLWRIFGRAEFPGALSLLVLVPMLSPLVAVCILAFPAWPALSSRSAQPE